MTSREYVQELRMLIFNPNLDFRVIDKMIYFLQQIEKDVEVVEIIKDNFVAFYELYHGGKWQLILKQKYAFLEWSKEYELLKEQLKK